MNADERIDLGSPPYPPPYNCRSIVSGTLNVPFAIFVVVDIFYPAPALAWAIFVCLALAARLLFVLADAAARHFDLMGNTICAGLLCITLFANSSPYVFVFRHNGAVEDWHATHRYKTLRDLNGHPFLRIPFWERTMSDDHDAKFERVMLWSVSGAAPHFGAAHAGVSHVWGRWHYSPLAPTGR